MSPPASIWSETLKRASLLSNAQCSLRTFCVSCHWAWTTQRDFQIMMPNIYLAAGLLDQSITSLASKETWDLVNWHSITHKSQQAKTAVLKQARYSKVVQGTDAEQKKYPVQRNWCSPKRASADCRSWPFRQRQSQAVEGPEEKPYPGRDGTTTWNAWPPVLPAIILC